MIETMRRRVWWCLCLLSATAGIASAQSWHDRSPHRSGVIQASGIALHYLDWGGTGEPLILLTGLGNSAHIFDDLAPKFTDRHRVVALTRRGHGESGKPSGGYDLDVLVDDIRRMLDALAIPRGCLIGHSFAGDEISEFARRYPERVACLVYLDAAYDHRPVPAIDDALPRLFPPRPRQDRAGFPALLAWQRKFYRTMTPAIEADDHAVWNLDEGGVLRSATSGEVYDAIEQASRRIDYSGIIAPVLSIDADDFWPELLAGKPGRQAEDVFAKLRRWREGERRRFRSALPAAEVVVMKDTSHYCFIQREAAVVQRIRGFLTRSVGG